MSANRPEMPVLLDRISFLVHRINAHLQRNTNPLLKRWGVDLTESRLLVALLENGPIPVGEIVRIMALPQSTISHQIKRLEKPGYVRRTQGDSDSRIVIAELTDKGRAVAVEANTHSRDVTDQMLAAIGEDEVELVRAALKRVDAAFANGNR
jgi:MarR family transcriptional regulator, organic hydroperoxide resistance regulator